MKLYTAYNNSLQKNPLVTKMLTSGTICGLGDLLCQFMERKFTKDGQDKKDYNFSRTKTFFIMGTFYVAPILHVSYSKILPALVPEVSAVGAVKKLALDQLIAAPLIILFFYPAINLVEGKPLSSAITDLKAKYVPTMITNYYIWPAANLMNFMFVPIQYQVLWANCVSLIFNASLSYIHNNTKTNEDSQKKD